MCERVYELLFSFHIHFSVSSFFIVSRALCGSTNFVWWYTPTGLKKLYTTMLIFITIGGERERAVTVATSVEVALARLPVSLSHTIAGATVSNVLTIVSLSLSLSS